MNHFHPQNIARFLAAFFILVLSAESQTDSTAQSPIGRKEELREPPSWETQNKALNGDPIARAELATNAYFVSLFLETQVDAQKGDPEAQVQLGNYYTFGEGVKMDRSEALKWFRKAAEQNYPAAQYIIGLRYRMGVGVEKNYSESVKWFRIAAENGYVEGQASLANCYQNGVGVDKDLVEAYAWWNLASISRFDPSGITNKVSAEARDILEMEMTPKQVTDAQRRTKELRAMIDAKLSRKEQ